MSQPTRRSVMIAVSGVVGVAAAGSLAYVAGLFGPFYPRTPYDDLLAKLPDRAAAERLGKAARTEMPGFDAKAVATKLRATMTGKSLSDVVIDDIDRNDLTEIEGWVLPASLAQLAALSA